MPFSQVMLEREIAIFGAAVRRRILLASLLLSVSPGAALAELRSVEARPADVELSAAKPVQRLAAWVARSSDNEGLPYAIVDKASATVFVFGRDGVLRGAAPALIGSAHGDDSAPGIGERELDAIRPEERTTPAGRFRARYGPAVGGRTVLWVDYATAVSLHEVVTSSHEERRLERLSSASPEDNRITYGCINVSTAVYEALIRPTFRGTESIFYVLPETRSLEEVFPRLRAENQRSRGRKRWGLF
jgi:hypothetical protein